MKQALNPIHPKTLEETKVKDIMNKRPPTINPDISIEEIMTSFRKQREGYLLVVDRGRKLIGIVTENDILHAFKIPSSHAFVGALAVREMGKGTATKAAEIMTRHPVTVAPDMNVRKVLNVMIAHKFRHLPVVERGKLVGSIAIRDILDSILKK